MTRPLSDALLLRVDPVSRQLFGSSEALEETLTNLAESASSQWPSVRVEPVTFIAYAADRLSPGAGLPELCELRLGDLYLAAGCAMADDAAIQALQTTYAPEVAKAIGHLDKTGALVDDVTQALWVKLLIGDDAKISAFRGRSRLWRWMRVVAIRLAIDLSSSQELSSRLADTSIPDHTGDIELDHLRTRYTAEFRRAFEEAANALPTEARTLLKLHLIDRLTIDQLGALRSVHRATAARHLQRARDQLAELTLERMRTHLQITSEELDSIMRLIRSRLDVSVARLLS